MPRFTLTALLALLTALTGLSSTAPAQTPLVQAETLTDQEVSWAIDALTEALFALRTDAGTWERQYARSEMANFNAHVTGQTTLAVAALLAAGHSYQDPRIRPALDLLIADKSDFTYVRGLRCHVWAAVPDKYSRLLDADRRWLLSAYDHDSGSWNYTQAAIRSGYDNSVTQYGVLGLWEAAKRRQEIPASLWERVEKHFLRTQLPDGGWPYGRGRTEPRGSMTAAGLTCLYICRDYLHGEEYLGVGLPESPLETAVRRGLGWMALHFSVDGHPGIESVDGVPSYYYYYLYGVERAGLASGERYFGEQDWFREGAAAIINRLCLPVYDDEGAGPLLGFVCKDPPDFPFTGAAEPPVVQLSFGLMFLARGRVPIAINKLRDPSFTWSNRPADASNLTAWLSDEVEQPFNWQVLDVDRPLEEWFDAPFVAVSSHDTLPWIAAHNRALAEESADRSPTTVEKIRRYLDLGGLLFTNADAASDAFGTSVRELAALTHPHLEWRRLPEDHWLYRMSAHVEKRPILYGLSNGVRELIIHCPQNDLGRSMQRNAPNATRDDFLTLGNLYYYASERNLARPRLARKLDLADPFAPRIDDPEAPFTILLGRHLGEWNPEPGAIDLAKHRLAQRGVEAKFIEVILSELPAAPRPGTLLWVRGLQGREFSERERDGLKRYLDGGGIALFETVGGIGSFASEAEGLIEAMYPSAGRFRTALRHPVVTGEGLPEATDCSRAVYRLFSVETMGARDNRPRLRHFDTGDADGPRIFVSREDLSHALLGQPRWGINGYSTESAADLLANLCRYSASGLP